MASPDQGGFDTGVNLEVLSRLLSRQSEAGDLDYKSTLDLTAGRDCVELAKDVAAMAVDGGHLVIGVDDFGALTGTLTAEGAVLFDEARLRGKLKRWLPEDLRLHAGRHEVDGKYSVVIAVVPYHDGLVVMKADGQYQEGGTSKTVFRAGDIFARHGTSSERMQQHDLRRILSRLVNDHRELWREDVLATVLATLAETSAATGIAQGPAAALTFQLPLATFHDAVIEQVRRGDLTPLRLLLMSTPRDIEDALTNPDALLPHTDLLDRVITVMALGVTLDDDVLFELGLDTLGVVYRTGLDARGFARQDTTIAPQQLWLDCLASIEAVGAFCVRRQTWDRVKRLAVHGPHPGEMEYYGNWHRHALTEAARRGLLQVRKADNDRALSVIELAAEAVARVGALHPDFQPGSDQITTSLCQYDSLAGLFGMDAAGQADGAHYYPNAAKYEERRTWPILDEVVSNPALRELFDADDTQLAEIMRTWVEGASKESAWGWHFGGVGPAVTFLAKHGPPPNP